MARAAKFQVLLVLLALVYERLVPWSLICYYDNPFDIWGVLKEEIQLYCRVCTVLYCMYTLIMNFFYFISSIIEHDQSSWFFKSLVTSLLLIFSNLLKFLVVYCARKDWETKNCFTVSSVSYSIVYNPSRYLLLFTWGLRIYGL